MANPTRIPERCSGSIKIISVFLLLIFIGCATVGLERFEAENFGQVITSTGVYTLHKASLITVQHVWESRTERLKHVEVVSFVDPNRMEIWFCTESGLAIELRNAESIRNLIEAAERDDRIAFPLIKWED